MKPKAPTEELLISDNLTFKLCPDLINNEPGRLESTFIELVYNMIFGRIYKHLSMKISRFNSEYLTPLLTNSRKEKRKKYLC